MGKILPWLRSLDLVVLLSLAAILAGVWLFIALAYGVGAGSTQHLDEQLLLALRNPENREEPLGPPWLADVGRDLTAFGGVAALCLVTVAVAGYLLICRKYRALLLLLAATLGGLLLSMLLKDLFDRPRPTVVPHLSYVSTSSFPSGHSMLSAVVYLTLGSLLARLVQQRGLKIYFLGGGLAPNVPGGREPRIYGSALSDRHPCRLVGGAGLGPSVWPGCRLAPAPRRGRKDSRLTATATQMRRRFPLSESGAPQFPVPVTASRWSRSGCRRSRSGTGPCRNRV